MPDSTTLWPHILPLDMKAALYRPLPAEAISAHPSKSYLSTIKPIYVIDRLNEVFGLGGWTYRSRVIEAVETKTMIVVKVTLRVPEYGICLEQYGGNDNPDRGDAYKGAVTDALTKCASYLGIGIDVYKGGGRMPGAGGRKNQAPRKPPQAAVAIMAAREPREEYDYEEVEFQPGEQSQLEEDLRNSILQAEQSARAKMLRALGNLKARYGRMDALKTYYAILGLWGVKHSTEFREDQEGVTASRGCWKELNEDVVRREVRR